MKMYTCLSILSLLTFRCASGCSENSGDKKTADNKTNSQDVVRPNDSSSAGNEETGSEKNLTFAVLGKGRQSLPSEFFSECLNLAKVYIPKNIVTVENEAFGAPTYIKDVYYSGSEEEWKAIDISESDLNKLMNSATIHYNQNF